LKRKKTILVAPLNWGLGHASRCMPIIDELLHQGAKVVLASDGQALRLLQAEYPSLPFEELPPYDISYKGSNMFLNIAPQVPKILRAIHLERQKLHRIISQRHIDAIISDNRYGVRHPQIPSILLTHQVNIQIGFSPLEWLIAQLNKRFIQQFDECWIPDIAKAPGLAGQLSHNHQLANARYIGLLSRMYYQPHLPKKYDVVAVLSGPEPQRSRFEQKIIQQVQDLPLKTLLIAGQTNQLERKQLSPNLTWQSYLTRQALQTTILQAEVIIARAGYSTIMDLIKLRCPKALLIPTPGQTEQEYLAQSLQKQNRFQTQTQAELNIRAALDCFEEKQKPTSSFIFESKLTATITDLLNTYL